MEDLHEGANILLAHWHYYRTDEDPLEVNVIDKHRSRLQNLGAEQFSFVKKSCRVMREKSEFPRPSIVVGVVGVIFYAWGFLPFWDRWVLTGAGEEFRQYPNWDDEVYWVCRMFDKDWSPGESFRS